ncbi:MAG TPA: hypothetical protein VGS22_12975 [Thermoanaerobaculia bacterium]|jgi:tetratricopeptide (TPR) repeat protein|nr:hypothetical protein [Thermoanaerobaculia bacterium]
MITHHPDARTLERFLDDLLAESESHAIQRHLLICPSCEERLIGLLPALGGPFGRVGDDLETLETFEALEAFETPDAANDRALRLEKEPDRLPDFGAAITRQGESIEQQRQQAPALWAELAPSSPEVRRSRVEHDGRFHTWALCELLLERSRALAPAEPAAALAAAELGLAVAERLRPDELPATAIASAQARAWGHLGNARRIFADYREAERCFTEAEKKLAASWLDPLDEGQLLQFQASLDRDLGRFSAGVERLETALEIYRSVNEPHSQGRCWISLGILLYFLEELDTADDCLRRGASLVDPERDPRLLLCAHQYLALGLLKAGRTADALAMLHNNRRRWAAGATELDRLRMRWLEAQILSGLDRLVEAQEILVEVQAGFSAARLPYDAALAGLELAMVYAQRGLSGNARRVAERTLPIFRSLDTQPAFVAAVIVFESAVEQDRLSLAALREISAVLEQARAGKPAEQSYLRASSAASAVSGAAQSAAFSRPISLPLL